MFRKLFKTWFLFIDDVVIATGQGESLEEAVSEDLLAKALEAPHYWAPPILTSAADVPIVLALHAENERLDEHINDCTLTSCIWTLSPREAFRSTNRG